MVHSTLISNGVGPVNKVFKYHSTAAPGTSPQHSSSVDRCLLRFPRISPIHEQEYAYLPHPLSFRTCIYLFPTIGPTWVTFLFFFFTSHSLELYGVPQINTRTFPYIGTFSLSHVKTESLDCLEEPNRERIDEIMHADAGHRSM